MSILTGFKQSFIKHGWLSLLALLFIAFFVRLGFWQLARADEKKQILANQQSYAHKKPIQWQEDNPAPKAHQRIKLRGRYLPLVFLQDNQHHQHQFGYHVLSPLLLENKHIVFVDRGWVAGDLMRKQLPEVRNPAHPLEISGAIYYPSPKRITLGSMIEKEKDNKVVIEWFDAEMISHFLQKSVYPFIIRLDKNESDGFVRQWSVVAMPPERHKAYALQWFAMALVMFILLVVFNIKHQLKKRSL